MNGDYILREESWLDQDKIAVAFRRADAEGCAEAFLIALDRATAFGAANADLSELPAWAQDQLREWSGDN